MRLIHAIATGLLLIGGGLACGQTIQLPSFRAFGVETTVVVPDSGPGPAPRRSRPPRTGPARVATVPRGTAQPIAATGARPADATIDWSRAARDSAPRGAADPKPSGLRKAAESGRDAVQALEGARRMRAAGKLEVAKAYYRAAARDANGATRDSILAELTEISPMASSASAQRAR